jgi:hypothetical protein
VLLKEHAHHEDDQIKQPVMDMAYAARGNGRLQPREHLRDLGGGEVRTECLSSMASCHGTEGNLAAVAQQIC